MQRLITETYRHFKQGETLEKLESIITLPY